MQKERSAETADAVSATESGSQDESQQTVTNMHVSDAFPPVFPAFPEQVQQIYTAESHAGLQNMRSMEHSLPQSYVHRQNQHPYGYQALPTLQGQYPYPSNVQFAGPHAMNYSPNFVNSYTSQFPSNPQTPQRQQSYPTLTSEQLLSHQPHNLQNVHYTMNPMTMQAQPAMGSTQGAYYNQQALNPLSNYSLGNQMNIYHVGATRINRNSANKGSEQTYRHSFSSEMNASPTILRGPPRKPKQSGFALWVGNLPPGTKIVDLKDHFAHDARDDIESVFLISKSNCAFVNYRSESACAAAMTRFHDSRFQGIRLVCRLRRGSAPNPAMNVSTPQSPLEGSKIDPADTEEEELELNADTPNTETIRPLEATPKVKEKFFIVKSLTLEDLERSVTSSAWATQPHNEITLNNAYKSAENVYLIFSANKSGEYFGYARMNSAIDDEAAATIDYPTREEQSQPTASDLPIAISTPATATAPKGRIIDDSARGTIFWEAEHEEGGEQTTKKEDERGGDVSEQQGAGGEEDVTSTAEESSAKPQAFGKPFKVLWMSTESLPFHRTRGMRNPWNSNREVKIARDGTEIEPMMGRRLISMFHRPQPGQPGVDGGGGNHRQAGVALNMLGGYVPHPGHQIPGPMYGRQF